MAYTATQWRDALITLLPPGIAFSTDADSIIGKTLHAWADGFARIEARAEQLLLEMDPRTVSEMLEEWEEEYGLPEICMTEEQSTTQRRNNLVAKVSALGDDGNTTAYLIALAAAAGFEITITPNTPDSSTFTVDAPEETVTEARVGVMRVGDRLRTWGNESLVCFINIYKPAHLTYNITFTGP